jgi:hypothetical protein
METVDLEARAHATQDMIEEHFFDDRGWLMERINQHTMDPNGTAVCICLYGRT